MTLSRWTLFRFDFELQIQNFRDLFTLGECSLRKNPWDVETSNSFPAQFGKKPKYPFLYDRSQLWAHKRPWSLRGLIFKLKYSWVVQFKQASQMNARSSQHVVEVEPKPELERKPRSLNEERSSDVAATYNELGTHAIWKSHRPKWIVSP